MSVNVSNASNSGRRATRILLLGSVGLLAIGAVVAQAASVTTKKLGVSAFISASLAAMIAAKTPAPVPTPAPTPAPAPDANAFRVGINATGIDYFNNDRPFINLIYGSPWQLNGAGGSYRTMPREYLDANGWVRMLPAGGQAVKLLNHPVVPQGGLDIVCRFDGAGRLMVNGAVSNVDRLPGETRFRVQSRFPNRENIAIFYDAVDVNNPIRNIDCREPSAPRDKVFSDEFVSLMREFGIIRFMDWQSTNLSNTVTWATRNRPESADYIDNAGVPIEHLVTLAKMTQADPWFNVSWNGSDDYVRKYAEYVRDNVPADRTIYIEASNEVWNAVFVASQQAEQEGLARGLSENPFMAKLRRYAQRSSEVFRIWSEVFAGQMHRIVRVANTQHANPWTAEQVLGFEDASQWIDALATAPYFGYGLTSDGNVGDLSPLFARLEAEVPESIALGISNKAVATRFGKRYITYEAGQHIIMHNDVGLVARLNRDQRMEDIYRAFMTQWRDRVGGPLMLFSATSPVSVWGAWGLTEYVGQPLSEAPKLRAVRAVNVR